MAVKIDSKGLQKLFPEIGQIENEKLRQGVIDVWLDVSKMTSWENFEDIPKNLKSEKYRPLVGHIRGVTQMAASMAEIAQKLHGTPYDRDMLLAACLLHDASKPLECEPNPEGEPSGGPARPGRVSDIGRNIQHGVYAAHKILEKNMALELAHLVITHTHSSNVRATSWEAALLFYADFADSDAAIFPTGEKTYAQRWKED